MAEALRTLETAWESPGGECYIEALEVWRHARELSVGFYYRWVWPRDELGRELKNHRWLEGRRAWRKFARNAIKHKSHVVTLENGKRKRMRYDSEGQVEDAVKAGLLSSLEYAAWKAVEPEYSPVVETIWICQALLEEVATRVRAAPVPALVWVEHEAFGLALAKLTGWPFFAEGVEQATILGQAGKTVILSSHSHKTGKNLQPWHYNVIVSSPPSGADWEQLIGRTHREGQRAAMVLCDVYLHTTPLKDGFTKAMLEARFLEQTLGQEQKLLVAERTFNVEGFKNG